MPDSSGSDELVILQTFLPAAAFAEVAAGAGSAEAGTAPNITSPEARMTGNTRRRIRSVSHAASRTRVTRGSTLAHGRTRMGFPPRMGSAVRNPTNDQLNAECGEVGR